MILSKNASHSRGFLFLVVRFEILRSDQKVNLIRPKHGLRDIGDQPWT